MDDPVVVEAVRQGVNQRAAELNWLVGLLRPRSLQRVLEVGTEAGGSLWVWCQLAVDDAQVMAVDDYSLLFDGLMTRFPWPAREGQRLKLHKGDSRAADTVTAAHEWATTPVSFLFIDADHSFDAVMQDWGNYSPLVAKGGLVGFHDVANQAAEAWAVLKRDHRTVEFVDPDNAGMGMGLIYFD
jgi:cephalosporin hydroxylase